MSHRAEELHATADTQVGGFIELLLTVDAPTWQRSCPGREKLGDGTIGAMAAHTAANYQRIGAFVATAKRASARHAASGPGGHNGHHDEAYTAAGAHPHEIVEQLAAARQSLGLLAEFTDEQLDAIPPKDSFRFCDGQRTLEQVLAGLFTHQGHQVRAVGAALSPAS